MNRHSRIHAPLLERGLLAVALLGLAIVLIRFDWLWRVDWLIYDSFLPSLSRVPSDDIITIAIDEKSLSALGRWPWPRSQHAALLDQLTKAGARAVAFDIEFAEPDNANSQSDAGFAAALKNNGATVLPVAVEQPHEGGPLIEILPLPILAKAAAALGHVDIELDGDGIARSVFLRAGLSAPYWPHLTLAMLQLEAPLAWTKLPGGRNGTSRMSTSGRWVRDNKILIPYAGPPGTFKAVSYVEAAQGRLSPAMFRDKFVLVGVTATGFGGQIPTPVSGLARPMPGVELNANILDALRKDLIIRRLDSTSRMVLTGSILLLSLLLYGYVSPRWSPVIAALLVLLTVTSALLALKVWQVWVAPSPALLVLCLSYPLWSWRQLQLTLDHIRQELVSFQPDLTAVPQPEKLDLRSVMEFLSTVLPVKGCLLCHGNGRIFAQWGETPSRSVSELAIGTWTRDGECYWLMQREEGITWCLGICWNGAEPPTNAQLSLLTELGRSYKEQGDELPPGAVDLVQTRLLQLRDATTRLRAMRRFVSNSFAQLPDGVVVADCLGRIRFANRRAVVYLDIEQRKDLEETALSQLLPTLRLDDERSWDDILRAILLNGSSVEISARSQRGRNLLVKVAPFVPEPGNAQGVVISFNDISILHAYQTRVLNDEKTRTHVTLDSIGDGVITLNAKGIVVYMNPVAETMTGVPMAEGQGMTLNQILHVIDEKSRTRIHYPTVESFARGHGTPVKLPEHGILINRSGAEYTIHVSAAPIHNEAGQILGLVMALTNITEMRRMAQEVTYQTTHDALTQLPNRTLLRDRLERAIAHAYRNDEWIGVLFIDLDRFKTVNEGLGHTVGDAVLKEMANRLLISVRREDTVARISGDEFVVIVENLLYEEKVRDIAQKILTELNKPVLINNHQLLLTGSIGISLFPRDGKEAETLLRNADMAMYRSKDNGRNRIQFYSEDMNTRAVERLVMERDLRLALERQELELYYQPQVDLASSRVIGFEALLRWRHPTHGMVSPGNFVPLAEETGLIIPIGEWVITTACQQCKTWQSHSETPLHVSVNLSPRQFIQQDLTKMVIMALDESGLESKQLDLEITESMIMRDVDKAITHFRELKAMGVSLSIDDFGTGYSSLNYLKQFPINRLKIDRSFVRDVTTDPNDAAIALAIIGMAQSMKLRVLAEGVETKAQLEFLRSRACDEMQGYYCSAPLTAQKADAFLQTRQWHDHYDENHSHSLSH